VLTRSPWKVVALALAGLVALTASALRADETLLTNLAGSDYGYGYVSSSTFRAFSFTTSGTSFNITSVTMRLYDYNSSADSSDIRLSIQVNSGSNTPSGTIFGALVAPTAGSGGYEDFVFTPESAITLAGNTLYWLVITSTSASESFAWARSNGAEQTPTGIATPGQQFISDNGNTGWHEGNDGPHTFAIQGNSVPEPGTCALVGIGLGLAVWMGRRRLG